MRELTCVQKISVNASILSDSGGTCVCEAGDGCSSDETYLLCVNDVRRDLITTSAAISALASALMGIFANMPVGLAPGLGLNAYVGTTSNIARPLDSLFDHIPCSSPTPS